MNNQFFLYLPSSSAKVPVAFTTLLLLYLVSNSVYPIVNSLRFVLYQQCFNFMFCVPCNLTESNIFTCVFVCLHYHCFGYAADYSLISDYLAASLYLNMRFPSLFNTIDILIGCLGRSVAIKLSNCAILSHPICSCDYVILNSKMFTL